MYILSKVFFTQSPDFILTSVGPQTLFLHPLSASDPSRTEKLLGLCTKSHDSHNFVLCTKIYRKTPVLGGPAGLPGAMQINTLILLISVGDRSENDRRSSIFCLIGGLKSSIFDLLGDLSKSDDLDSRKKKTTSFDASRLRTVALAFRTSPTFWGDKLLVVGTIIMGSFFLHPFLGDDLLEISLG